MKAPTLSLAKAVQAHIALAEESGFNPSLLDRYLGGGPLSTLHAMARGARVPLPDLLPHVLDRIAGGDLGDQDKVAVTFDGRGTPAIAFGDGVDYLFTGFVQVGFAQISTVHSFVQGAQAQYVIVSKVHAVQLTGTAVREHLPVVLVRGNVHPESVQVAHAFPVSQVIAMTSQRLYHDPRDFVVGFFVAERFLAGEKDEE